MTLSVTHVQWLTSVCSFLQSELCVYLRLHNVRGVRHLSRFDNLWRPDTCNHLMFFLRISKITRVVAFSAVLIFAADVVADSIADACGDHCVSQSSQSDSHNEKTPCSHCSCAIHNGAVVASTVAAHVMGGFEASAFLPASDEPAPTRLPASIDHPPQLA